MELEYSDRNRRRSKLYIFVGIIVALVVAATVYVALQASGLTDAAPIETRSVVVAAADIAGRQPIAEADIATREVVADPANAGAYTSVDDVIGRITAVPIPAGQVVAPNLLASTTEGQTFSILAPGEEFDPEGPDYRAVSVTVGEANAVAGTLTAGQRVDLVVTMQVNPATEGELVAEDEPPAESELMAGPATKVTLQQMTILARSGDLYILRADLQTAEKIIELTAAGGTFTMVLRPEQDDRQAETEGSTIDRLIEEYDFPAPQQPDFDDRP